MFKTIIILLIEVESLSRHRPWSKKTLGEAYYSCVNKKDSRRIISIHIGDWRKSSTKTFRTKDSKDPAVQNFVEDTRAYHEV